MKKKINILGSTGFIGKKVLKIIHKDIDSYKINFLLANNNFKLLAKQANFFKPLSVGIINKKYFKQLKNLINNNKIKIIAGDDCYNYLKSKVDISILAISGISSLKFIDLLIINSNKVGIVNKECIVSAGEFIMRLAKKHNTKIIPLDSEHYSIYNFLLNYNLSNFRNLKKIYLTASGGPFLNTDANLLRKVSLKAAINHPTWKMGYKNSIDSSTMINKCLEIIEAHYLFNLNYEQLDFVIHPESLVHSIINNLDGSLIFNLFNNDMSIPIYSALNDTIENPYNNLNVNNIHNISFINPSRSKFKSLKVFDQLDKSSTSEIIVFNASNEYAVNLFIKNKIKYDKIVDYINKSLNRFEKVKICNIKEVIQYQNYVYKSLHNR